jgi:hypothetical protein
MDLFQKPGFSLVVLLVSFVILQSLLPLRTTIKIGGDEGFELSKALLCLKGHRLYTEVWNDQPPLHTFLITETLKYITPSILGPRLVTTGFTLLLLAALFFIVLRFNGLIAATLTMGLLIASPGFLALGSSCMLEMPALATSIAALCVLLNLKSAKWPLGAIMSGLLFGAGCQIKLISVILLVFVPAILWFEKRDSTSPKMGIIRSLVFFSVSLLISFVGIDLLVDDGAYLAHFGQSWISHFAATKSFEYGSPADHPFDWRILFRNWDATLPAALGVVILFRQAKTNAAAILPALWLGLVLLVFSIHRPWWSYYYLHISIPLCWCAAIGILEIGRRAGRRKLSWCVVLLAAYAVFALPWLVGRLCVQVAEIRKSPQTYTALVLPEIERFKPFTEFMYADDPVYSFHAGIPLPPDLAVVMLKRLWSGDMTNAKITEELTELKPGVILLANDAKERPFRKLLTSDYRMIYEDSSVRLYILKSIVHKADP